LLGLAEIDADASGDFSYQRMGVVGYNQNWPVERLCGARIGSDAITTGRCYQNNKAWFIARLWLLLRDAINQ
jgi:hypothetical protein